MQAPPGQVHKVISDLQGILQSSSSSFKMDDQMLTSLVRQYNLKNHFPIQAMQQHSDENSSTSQNDNSITSLADVTVVLSQEAQIDATHYLYPKRRQVVEIDHLTQKVVHYDDTTEEESKEHFSSPYENERLAIEKAMETYSDEKFGSKYYSSVLVSKDNQLTIVCSAQRINLRNYWSGQWTSKWIIDNLQTSNELVLKGTIKLAVHYFENGNLQLHSQKDLSIPLKSAHYFNPEELGQLIKTTILNAENVIQSNLEKMYLNMKMETLKEMRRVMPITQTKMDWSIHTHRTAKTLNK